VIVTESYVEKNIKNHGFGSKTASRTFGKKGVKKSVLFFWNLRKFQGIKDFVWGIKVFSGELRFFLGN
jgi:hypothetical protein